MIRELVVVTVKKALLEEGWNQPMVESRFEIVGKW